MGGLQYLWLSRIRAVAQRLRTTVDSSGLPPHVADRLPCLEGEKGPVVAFRGRADLDRDGGWPLRGVARAAELPVYCSADEVPLPDGLRHLLCAWLVGRRLALGRPSTLAVDADPTETP